MEKWQKSSTSGSTTARPSSFCFTSLICHSDRFLRLLTMRPWSRSPLFVTSTRCVKLVRPWVHGSAWFQGAKVCNLHGEWEHWLFIAWVFGREKLFETVAAKLAKSIWWEEETEEGGGWVNKMGYWFVGPVPQRSLVSWSVHFQCFLNTACGYSGVPRPLLTILAESLQLCDDLASRSFLALPTNISAASSTIGENKRL